jgi:hypothetical protein
MVRLRALPAPIFKLLAERDLGILPSLALERAIIQVRAEQLALNPRRQAEFCHDSSILCMDVDKAEDRYLLCGYANGAVGILDVEDTASRDNRIFNVVLRIEPGPHRYGVTGVAWYPLDTGMFVSSSFDKTVKVQIMGSVIAVCMHFDGRHFLNHYDQLNFLMFPVWFAIQVWDTNAAQDVFTFQLSDRVFFASCVL